MPSKLSTITCDALMSTQLEPTRFIIADILPQGLHILGGAPKIGKSWLVLHLCLQIAKGEKVWDYETEQGSVLYLSLEDSLVRLQERVEFVTDVWADRLHFATMADSIANGLDKQIESFILENPDTHLIAIDTLQRVRDGIPDTNAYASDYKDIGILKAIADKHKIAILLVHHLRKMTDADPVNMISGTTGLTGAVDGVYVLRKEKRSGNRATFIATGRDIEDRELTIEFDRDTHLWLFVSDESECENAGSDAPVDRVIEYLRAEEIFIGSGDELADALKNRFDYKISGAVLSKKLKSRIKKLRENGISYEYHRTRQKREISLLLEPPISACDTSDGSDGKNDSEVNADELSRPQIA